MPKATSARKGEHVFDVERALELRRTGHNPDFRCMECGNPVRAHKKGTTGQEAHFEHLQRNPACSLSR